MALMKFNFESQYLMNNHEISVIMPDSPRGADPRQFYESGVKYQVLWLLHGSFGDHSDWTRKSNIELYATERNLVVVMPTALNSNYVNWDGFGLGYKMWEYLFEELMPMIYNWLPVSNKREDNFIAGLSMGGMGTMQYVCGHPEKFAAAAVLSAVPFDLHKPMENEIIRKKRVAEIANAGGMEKYIKGPENVWDQLPELVEKKKLPQLYFAIGDKDFMYPYFLEFKDYAEKLGMDASFEEYKGYNHEWRFWELTIQKALDFFGIKNVKAGNPF